MKFSGRLQIETDPKNWLTTVIELSNGRLELVSGGEILGSWSITHVKAERIEGDKFQLHLGDDRAMFSADDALAFSYEALPILAKKSVLAAAGGLRGKLRKAAAPTERPSVPERRADDPPPARNDPVVEVLVAEAPPPARKLRDLIQNAVRDSPVDAPVAAVPVASEPPKSPAAEPLGETRSFTGPLRAVPPRVLEEETHEREEEEPIRPLREEETTYPAMEPSLSEALLTPRAIPLLRSVPDLSPIPMAPRVNYGTKTLATPEDSFTKVEETGFAEGETLGDRPAEPSGWVRAIEKVKPASELRGPAALAPDLNSLVDDVRRSGMSPSQVSALADLMRGLADAIEDKHRP
jgi:hypothetical protein